MAGNGALIPERPVNGVACHASPLVRVGTSGAAVLPLATTAIAGALGEACTTRTSAGVLASTSRSLLPNASNTASRIGALPGPVLVTAAITRSAPSGNVVGPESNTTVAGSPAGVTRISY